MGWPAVSAVRAGLLAGVLGIAPLPLRADLPATTAAPNLQVEVVDGDTLRLDGRPVRIRGLDAPESRGRCARERELAQRARGRLAELVRDGVSLERLGRDRYGRDLAAVRDAAGRDVAQVLIAEALAIPYDGTMRRPGWCG